MPSHPDLTRRQFLNRAALASLATSLPARALSAAGPIMHDSEASAFSRLSPRNRAPLAAAAFYFLPLGSIRPAGWLRNQLEIQANGLSGHLDETWADVGPNSGWLGGTGESWERGPYFLDGLTPLAWLLDDERLKAKVHRFMEWTLTHQEANGMIGPATNDDWWPRIVMLKALAQYQELTGDSRVIPLMDRYFRHQLAALPNRPLRDWGKFRWQDEALSVIWLYNRSGSSYLIELANLLHQQGHDWMAEYADFQYKQKITAEFIKLNEGGGLKGLALSTHGVNNAQALKTGAVWSQVSGDESDRAAVARMLAELDQYHGLPNGMFSCDEHLAGRDPSQGSELCSVVESMFSLEQALAITGNAAFGDRLEKLAFNALPGTFTDDMWAHQYNQEPNQVMCSLHHKPWTTDGPESNLYGLEPNFGCCTANFHQGWPKFTNVLFLLSGNDESHDGLVAAAYAPCEVNATLRGIPVHVLEETGYPFEETIRLTVSPASPLSFPLQLRIPVWAEEATIRINGQAAPKPAPGTFASLERTWRAGDRVELSFPMPPRFSRWFNNSIAIERGPLVFSFGIGESWVKLRDRGMTADWQVFPATGWNYALHIEKDDPAKSLEISTSKPDERVFTRRNAPVRMRVKASRIDAWRAEDGAADPLPQSPASSGQPEEKIELIPYAAAKLRITAFPESKS